MQQAIATLKGLIDGAPADRPNFVRFVFLHQSQGRGMAYNIYEGRAFDALIDATLVTRPGPGASGYFRLNLEHPRNRKIVEALAGVAGALEKYLADHDPDADDLFTWSLDDAEFWKKYIGYSVL